jgi:uncharacterized protein YifN (PemK superfamily)
MAITFHPEPRMVLVCDFTTGFKEPEMVKVRPVIVLSPQRNKNKAGTRLYVAHKVMEIDWAATQHAVAIALGLGNRLI